MKSLERVRFHHHTPEPGEEVSGNRWFEGETRRIGGSAMKGKGTRGADFQVWVHLHSSKPEMTIEEANEKKANTQARFFPYLTAVKPCNPPLDSREPDEYGFLARVQCDRPFMTEIY